MTADSPAEAPVDTLPRAKPPTPTLLGKHGRKLWRSLTDKYDFDPWEVPIVEAACRQRDDIALLEDHLREHGILTRGSTGQVRLDQAVTEVRLARRALAGLLAALKIPAEEAEPGTPAGKPLDWKGRRAQGAANTRWHNHRRRRGDLLEEVDLDDGATS